MKWLYGFAATWTLVVVVGLSILPQTKIQDDYRLTYQFQGREHVRTISSDEMSYVEDSERRRYAFVDHGAHRFVFFHNGINQASGGRASYIIKLEYCHFDDHCDDMTTAEMVSLRRRA